MSARPVSDVRPPPDPWAMAPDPVRIMVVTPITAPYRVPVFNALASLAGVDLRVLYLAERDPDRRWPSYRAEMRYAHRILPELLRLRRHGGWVHVSRGVVGEVRAWRPDVLVAGGWDQPADLLAFLLRRPLGIRFAWWVESTARDARPRSALAEAVKRRLVASADAVVVPGAASARYVASLGGRPERVFTAPNAVDNDFFARHGRADRGRRRGRPRFLFVGRLHPSKGMDVLLDAWARTGGELGSLTLVGDGPERGRMARRIRDERWRSVRMTGHLDREALAAEYARADVFVLPSRSDPWGLVLNEAMAAGLPVIATAAPGAVDDLVRPAENGVIVPPGDPDALAGAMRGLAADRAGRLAMGRRSLEAVRAFSPQACAEGLALAARACAGRGRSGADAEGRR